MRLNHVVFRCRIMENENSLYFLILITVINLSKYLIDDSQCYTTVRQLRLSEGTQFLFHASKVHKKKHQRPTIQFQGIQQLSTAFKTGWKK